MASLETEVETRLKRPFEQVRRQLTEMFDMEWEEIEVVISTRASKHGSSEADVICHLVAKAEAKPPVHDRMRRAAIRWVGKPWRERANPWDRFKDRVPPPPPPTKPDPDDLNEWTPFKPEED